MANAVAARAEPDWLSERRRKGASLALELPLPDAKKKGWEFTDLAGLDLEAYEPAGGTVGLEDGGAAEAGALVLPLEVALGERGETPCVSTSGRWSRSRTRSLPATTRTGTAAR